MGQNVSCLVTIFIITHIGGPGHWAAFTLDNKEAIEMQIIGHLNTVTPPERKRIQISLAATVIYLLFTALVSTVYTLHTSRRRADRTVFSVHKTQINSTKDRGS